MVLDPAQKLAWDRLRDLQRRLATSAGRKGWARFFSARKAETGLYLWGGVGRGKTMLMDMFFGTMPEDVATKRVHFHEFMIGVHEFMHEARKKGLAESALLKYAKTIAAENRVLCFDEFHVTDIADAMILGRLFDALFSGGVTVVATSNWPPDRLYEGGLQRDRFLPFIATLKDNMEVLEVDGGIDYRLQCLTDTGVYFWPLGTSAQASADEVFRRLTGGAAAHAEELTVRGRTLPVERTAKGVARFLFSRLCEQPLGAEDYLSIARAYHTVFLEKVPKLGYDRRNEAKRLMTLIDTLYDNDIKLIVTADAAPEELYRGQDHGFEFQRTVSRLVEMQSPAYLERKNN